MPLTIRHPLIALTLLVVAGCQHPEKPVPLTPSASLQDFHFNLEAAAGPAAAVPMAARDRANFEPIIIRHTVAPPSASARETSREEGSIHLNFDKAALRTVIDAVLGDALAVPYTIDDKVDGTVSLVSPRGLTRAEALDVLDGLLRANNATLVRGESVYRVVATNTVRPLLGAPTFAAGVPGYAVSIYVPQHMAAASLQKLIEPIYQIPNALESDAQHNILLIIGGPEERRTLIDAARLFDQDWLANQSVGIYPLRWAQPKVVARELRTLLAAPGGDSENGPVRVSVVDRLNAVMIVSQQPKPLDQATAWIARLDQIGPGERSLHVYPVQYGKVQNVARVLSRLFGGGGGDSGGSSLPPGTVGATIRSPALATQGTSPTGPSFGSGLGANGSAGGSSGGMTASLLNGDSDNGRGDEVSPGAGNETTNPNGPRIIADALTNSLLIMANQAEIEIIEPALASLDMRPPQILIEATIVEVSLNKNLQYGVQYFLRGNPLLKNPDSSIGLSTDLASGTLQGQYPGFNAVLGTLSNPSVVISALDSVTDVKIISSPQLVVTDSHKATLKVGTQTPLLTQQSVSTLTSGAPVVNSIEYRDTGVILYVLPHANSSGIVSLDITQEVSDVVPSAANPLTPSIEERSIQSSVAVQGGQTVMLGGLISENSTISRSGLPLLATVPYLGGLFGQQGNTGSRTELIVFITPHIIHTNSDAQQLTQELMSRLKSLQTPTRD